MLKSLSCYLLLAAAVIAPAAHAQDAPKQAVTFEAAYTGDVTGVVQGGLSRRGRYLDNIDLVMDVDLAELAGWNGASLHFDILNNSGGMPNEDAGTLQGVDNIEVASQRLRLFEAWFEQSFGDSSIRAGLYDVNSEFYSNDAAGLLMAPMFGIGSEIAATGPNGPSIFPSTALAVRYDIKVFETGYVRAAALNASASVFGDPNGVDTDFDNGLLLIAEAGIQTEGKIALGVWGYTEKQDDIRELDLNGDPVQRNAQGAYLLLEHPLGHADGAPAAFFRAGVSEGKTTPFKGGWQAGVLFEHVIPNRPQSMVSFGFGQGILSSGYKANQTDLGVSMDNAEWQMELTYSDEIMPHVTIQPDLQFIRRPSGDRSIKDAVIAGLRISIST
jgi:porin